MALGLQSKIDLTKKIYNYFLKRFKKISPSPARLSKNGKKGKKEKTLLAFGVGVKHPRGAGQPDVETEDPDVAVPAAVRKASIFAIIS